MGKTKPKRTRPDFFYRYCIDTVLPFICGAYIVFISSNICSCAFFILLFYPGVAFSSFIYPGLPIFHHAVVTPLLPVTQSPRRPLSSSPLLPIVVTLPFTLSPLLPVAVAPLRLLLFPLFFDGTIVISAKHNPGANYASQKEPDKEDHRSVWFCSFCWDGYRFNNCKDRSILLYLYFCLFELLGEFGIDAINQVVLTS